MGSTTVNVVPTPGALRKLMLPPWSSMILWVSASPRPVPAALVVKNGSNTLSASEGEMPLPESSISTRIRRRPVPPASASALRCQPVRTVSRPPVSIASSALLTRLTNAS